ncbi:MAG: hydrogenase maturation protease [Anaerolineales bacterium]
MPPDAPLVIGIGNPLRGDDRLGWEAVAQLRQHAGRQAAELLCVQQLSMDLVETVAQATRVLFIDARAGEPTGQLEAEILAADSCLGGYDSHFFEPTTLLAVVQALYGAHPPATLLSLRSVHFEYGETLSPEAAQALPALMSEAQAWLQEC